MSPNADGPIKFTGTLDNNLNIENISRFGRSFSIVRVPYSFKLLMQELQTMNIQMRIITEDNVDQLQSMSYSRTINNLLFDDNITVNDIIQTNKQKLEKETQQESTKFSKQQTRAPAQTFTAIPPPPDLYQTSVPGPSLDAAHEFVPAPYPGAEVQFENEFAKPPLVINKDSITNTPTLDIQELPPLEQQSIAPQYGNTSPQYGNTSPQYGNTSPQYGNTSPQYGNISPQYGNISPQYGNTSPIIGPPGQTPAPQSVKAIIEVPAGQQGQFTITSSGLPTDEPSSALTSQVNVNEEPKEEEKLIDDPFLVTKKDEQIGGSEDIKTIKI